jgi:hypothetical protein
MSVVLVQLPEEFFEAIKKILNKIDAVNYNVEKTESLNVELIETLEKTNSLLEKMLSSLDEIKRKP